MISINQHLDQIRQSDSGKARKEVVILGAGMAGLTAAYELQKLGHRVEVLEASNRVGGRVLTKRFDDGTYGELGAMRIPAIHTFVRHYISQLGLKLRKFVSSHGHLDGFYDIRDIQTRMKDAKANLYPHLKLSQHEAGLSGPAPAILDEHFNSVINSLNDDEKLDLATGDLTSSRMKRLDRISLGDFFEMRAGDDAKELIGATSGLEPWWDRAVTVFLREQILEPWNGLEEIVGGFDQLPNGISACLKGNVVKLNHRVKKIGRSENHVTLEIDGPTGHMTKQCDQILCTIPFSVLRRIEVDPPFSSDKSKAIRNLSYASATKVLLHCKERFWETKYGIYGGASQSDQPIRATYYPCDNVSTGLPSTQKSWWGGLKTSETRPSQVEASARPGVLVGTYCWEQDARRIGAIPGSAAGDPPGSLSQRATAVMKMISRFHPDIEHYVDDEASIDWNANPFSAGAYLFLRPNERSTIFQHAAKPEPRIYFAGEHTSLDHAWIEGAITSAIRAVEEIVSA